MANWTCVERAQAPTAVRERMAGNQWVEQRGMQRAGAGHSSALRSLHKLGRVYERRAMTCPCSFAPWVEMDCTATVWATLFFDGSISGTPSSSSPVIIIIIVAQRALHCTALYCAPTLKLAAAPAQPAVPRRLRLLCASAAGGFAHWWTLLSALGRVQPSISQLHHHPYAALQSKDGCIQVSKSSGWAASWVSNIRT